MKRLVYAPRIDVFVKADTGIYDISPYVTSCQVNRKINAVSTAQVSFRNPGLRWTEHTFTDPISKRPTVGPIFHPMDPIFIAMTRLRDRQIAVFTGYCDTTPYLQLFPGIVNIAASCTLKRLLYTYWDPGLPFVHEFLETHGWIPNADGRFGGDIVNVGAGSTPRNNGNEDKRTSFLNDTGVGKLMYDILTQVGGWNDKNIYIERLPVGLFDRIAALYDQFKSESEQGLEEFKSLLHEIIGTSSLGSGSPGGTTTGSVGGSGPASGTEVKPVDVGRAMITVGWTEDEQILANGIETMSGESGFGTASGWDVEHDGGVLGYWQIQRTSHPEVSAECCMNLLCSTKAAHSIWQDAGNCFACLPGPNPWQGGTDSGSAYLSEAREAITLGPFTDEEDRPEAHDNGKATPVGGSR